jgi:DNA-binding MarR family transcriptional regulator
MDQYQNILNRFLVDMFNEILKAEELTLSKKYKNLSIKEFHVIEVVCAANESGNDNSTATIAENLRITPGSLTVAVNTLEKKGYLVRQKIDKDKRIVRIFPTELGLEVNQYHSNFHTEMVQNVLSTISEDEAVILLKTLGNISVFFRNKYMQHKED